MYLLRITCINRATPAHPANAEFSYDARNKKMNIKARKNIYDGDEIFIPYGNRYNMNDLTLIIV